MDTSCESSGRPTHPAGFFADESDLSERFPGHDSIDFPVAVVLPAGGSGERMGLATPKQFCTVFNRPLISYTIQAFERISWIENIVVVVAKESLHLMMDIIHKFCHKKVKVLLGGSSRHRSIFNGLQAFGEMPDGKSLRKPKVVIIHDAVRPFVEEDFLLRITIAAKEQGASGAIRPLVSTVIATTSEGYIDHSLERAKYRASEMPQGFVYDIIYQAYQQCSESDFEFGTECLHLALQYCGTNAKLIEGPPALWKVTYKKDLFAAESVIKDFLSQACVITTVCAESAALAHRFQKSLGARSMGCVYYIKQGEVCCRHYAVVQVDVISGSFGNNQPLVSKTWNFIHITANIACLAEISRTVKTLHEAGQALLYPAVLILDSYIIRNSLREKLQFPASSHVESPHTGAFQCPAAFLLTERMGQLGAIRHLAMEAKHRNILLYAILLNHNENAEQWEETVESASEITTALVKDRNPALAGQLLVA